MPAPDERSNNDFPLSDGSPDKLCEQPSDENRPRFPLGQVVTTPGALSALVSLNVSPSQCLALDIALSPHAGRLGPA